MMCVLFNLLGLMFHQAFFAIWAIYAIERIVTILILKISLYFVSANENRLTNNLLPMHAYFRNHQLYLAERSDWLDRHVTKTSQRALMKIESWKLIVQSGEGDNQLRLVEKLLKDSLLTSIPTQTILHKEGFFLSNLDN